MLGDAGAGAAVPPKLGFDENEQLEFSRQVHEQLLVQTPLQVLLEMLYSKLQSQANLFTELQRRVDRLESRDLGTKELLRRLQMCEGQLHDLGAAKLSPFKQQEILTRLEALEATFAPGGRAAKHAEALERAAGMEDRLEAVETRLGGVYNLNGKLIALEQVADSVGIDIPDLEYNPGMDTASFFEQSTKASAPPAAPTAPSSPPRPRATSPERPAAAPAPAPASARGSTLPPSAATTPRGLLLPPSPERSSALAPPSSPSRMQAEASRLSAATAGRGGAPRLADVAAAVDTMAEEAEALRATVDELRATLASTVESVGSHAARVSALEATSSALSDTSAATERAVATLASRKAAEVSFADFSALADRVAVGEAAAKAASGHAQQVKDLRAAIDALQMSVPGVADGDAGGAAAACAPPGRGGGTAAQAGSAGATKDHTDAVFHARISAVEGKLDGVRAELASAVSELSSGCARAADVDALTRGLGTKAAQADIKTLAQQQAALATSINGMAEWLAMRPDGADGAKGTGGSITRFRCLTCDREMKSQGTPNGSAVAKGSFLPRLEGMAALGSPAGGASSARVVSPVRGAEFDLAARGTAAGQVEAAPAGGGAGGGSPGRSTRTPGSGRGGARAATHATPVFMA